MPRDKTATNKQIISCMTEEFLSYGYENASLNRISRAVGITTAALYKHFNGKEDMFAYLVRDTIDALERSQMTDPSKYDPMSESWADSMAELVFSNYRGLKLLVCCSSGSGFVVFEEKLISETMLAFKKYAEILERSGHSVKNLTDMQMHVLATEYIHIVLEAVRHDLTKQQMLDHMRFARSLICPAWREIFGI
ncbi:MAG: TetR/AcrR family transcriptional regulator [Ruminococcus sp.]|nr:TetR/AcrR family transcriptional regulator [Ruminococcus sp.]